MIIPELPKVIISAGTLADWDFQLFSSGVGSTLTNTINMNEIARPHDLNCIGRNSATEVSIPVSGAAEFFCVSKPLALLLGKSRGKRLISAGLTSESTKPACRLGKYSAKTLGPAHRVVCR